MDKLTKIKMTSFTSKLACKMASIPDIWTETFVEVSAKAELKKS